MSSGTTFLLKETRAGYDAMVIKYLATAVGTLLLYDYILTFLDEMQFWWGLEKKGWAFYLFLFNRYCPILYEAWILCALEDLARCETIIKIQGVCFLLFLLGGQVFTTARLYVASGQRHAVLAVLLPIALAQLVVGLVIVFLFTSPTSGVSMGVSTLEVCFFAIRTRMAYAYIGLALSFDAAILLGVTVTFGSSDSFLFSSYLLRELLRETCVYSLVTVCSHLTMLTLQLLGSHTLKAAPILAVTIITPVVVSRMVLSLAKSAVLNKHCRWELDHFTVDTERERHDTDVARDNRRSALGVLAWQKFADLRSLSPA